MQLADKKTAQAAVGEGVKRGYAHAWEDPA